MAETVKQPVKIKKISRNKSKGKYKEYLINNTRIRNKKRKLEKHLHKHPGDKQARRALISA